MEDLDRQCEQALGPGRPVKFVRVAGGATYVRDWSPSTNADDARDLEDEIERRRLKGAYTHALVDIVRPKYTAMSSWLLIHATPEQRTLAFLKVVSHDHDLPPVD